MYTLNVSTGVVTRNSDHVQVAPVDNPNNVNYQDYLAWVAAGNTPDTTSEDALQDADWIITRFAFRNRMTTSEKIKLDFMSNDRPDMTDQERLIAATLRVFSYDLDQAEYVYLKSKPVNDGLDVLVSLGVFTQERADEILRTIPTQIEKPGM